MPLFPLPLLFMPARGQLGHPHPGSPYAPQPQLTPGGWWFTSQDNTEGSMEFRTNARDADDFFPVLVSFTSGGTCYYEPALNWYTV